jgi:DNA-directed RNA polymerase subunit M/transcription elongation factor TFIIS
MWLNAVEKIGLLAVLRLKKFILIGCPKCKALLYCRSDRKTTECRRCGYRIRLLWTKVRPLYTTDSPREIISVLQQAKMRKATSRLWRRR